MDSEPERDTPAKTQAVIAVALQLQVCAAPFQSLSTLAQIGHML